MICEYCSGINDGNFGSGRFCSPKCSRGFSTRNKREEINEKIRNKILGTGNPNIIKVCKNCKKEFEVKWKYKKRTFCSKNCSNKNIDNRNKVSESKKNQCKSLQERQRLRDIGRKGGFGKKGYTSSGVYYTSILEKECFEYLENINIKYEAHKHLPDSSKVSDVYLIEQNVWIELDGINREKRKEWLGSDYLYWKNKLTEYKDKELKLEIVYSLEGLKEALKKYY